MKTSQDTPDPQRFINELYRDTPYCEDYVVTGLTFDAVYWNIVDRMMPPEVNDPLDILDPTILGVTLGVILP